MHRALSDLPDGSNAAVEIPNLQPSYSGPRPAAGAERFVIRLWQLQLGRWLLSRAGGNTLMDRMRSSSLATWQFFNVAVEPYTPRDCFAAATTQVCRLAARTRQRHAQQQECSCSLPCHVHACLLL